MVLALVYFSHTLHNAHYKHNHNTKVSCSVGKTCWTLVFTAHSAKKNIVKFKKKFNEISQLVFQHAHIFANALCTIHMSDNKMLRIRHVCRQAAIKVTYTTRCTMRY